MSISSELTYVEINGTDSAATVYTVDLRVIDVSHIKIYKKLIAGGLWVAVTSGYTITLTGTQGSTKASVVFTAAPGSTYKLRFLRYVPVTQPFEYPVSGSFPAKSHEDGLDRLTMCVQQAFENALTIDPNNNTIGRVLFTPPTTATASLFGLEVTGGAMASKVYALGDVRPHLTYSGGMPTSADIESNAFGIHYNSSLGKYYLALNIGGTIKKLEIALA